MNGPLALRTLLQRWRPGGLRPACADPAGIISAAWEDAVGPQVARRTRPGRIRNGTLSVLTTGSTWSHQLTFLEPAIIANLRRRCPEAGIRRLRFSIATAKTKALLEGAAAAWRPARHAERKATDEADDDADTSAQDLEGLLRRIRRRQEALNRRRMRAGWSTCSLCSAWFDPPDNGALRCAVCKTEARRRADGELERALCQAPWLDDAALSARSADREGYERVRRRLLSAWEAQLHLAAPRLRAGSLEGADRVVAWSYLMLLLRTPQSQIGAAAISDALSARWATALLGGLGASARKAKTAHFTNVRGRNVHAS
ncbi:MAG: DUF721 domain-containing protein [Candidatus Eremiobacteraeota bacterium]|nr:DUF721 domain-containing protein [Candidatus Eremiobacteraeota bacterium]